MASLLISQETDHGDFKLVENLLACSALGTKQVFVSLRGVWGSAREWETTSAVGGQDSPMVSTKESLIQIQSHLVSAQKTSPQIAI